MTEMATQPPAQQPVTTEDAKEAVKEKGQELRTQASDRARQEVEQRSTQAGEQVQTFAQTLRRTASELRTQGQEGQGNVLDQVAIRAEQAAGYLTQAEADRMLGDAKTYGQRALNFVRQQKWLVAPVGLGVGIVAARRFGGGGSNGSDGSAASDDS